MPAQLDQHFPVMPVFVLSLFLIFYNTVTTFTDSEEEGFEKHFGKRRICRNQHVLHFQKCFSFKGKFATYEHFSFYNNVLTLSETSPGFYMSAEQVF